MENYASSWKLEQLFTQKGPFVHLYTKPLETILLVEDDEDRKAIMNLIALESREQNIDVLAYALMSNHFHLILQAEEETSSVFYGKLHRRIVRYLGGSGKGKQFAEVISGTTRITSLKQFRDVVAYVIRNPFVVRDDVNLFACLWCSGFLYFNPFLNAVSGKPGRVGTCHRKSTLPPYLKNPLTFQGQKRAESPRRRAETTVPGAKTGRSAPEIPWGSRGRRRSGGITTAGFLRAYAP